MLQDYVRSVVEEMYTHSHACGCGPDTVLGHFADKLRQGLAQAAAAETRRQKGEEGFVEVRFTPTTLPELRPQAVAALSDVLANGSTEEKLEAVSLMLEMGQLVLDGKAYLDATKGG